MVKEDKFLPMLDNLRASFNSIFDLYRQKSRSFFNFSLGFLVLSSLWSVVIAWLLFLAAYKAGLVPDDLHRESLQDLLTYPFMAKSWTAFSAYLVILSLGLYAIYLHLKLSDNESRPSTKDFFKTVSSDNWKVFFFVTGLLSLVQILKINEPFESYENGTGLLRTLKMFSRETRMMNLYKWLNAIADLIVTYLPYIGALYIVLSDRNDRPGRELLKSAKTVLTTVLILSFCLDAFSSNINYYIHKYLIGLFEIPFPDNVSLGIFGIAIVIIISAYFFPAMAGSILFPVIHDEQMQMNEEFNDAEKPDLDADSGSIIESEDHA
jgi:hypothetical protein